MHKLVSFLLHGIILIISMSVFVGSVLALGTILSAKPLHDLRYKGLNGDPKVLGCPYTSYVFLGWAITFVIGLVVTSVLPIISWFATYRFPFPLLSLLGFSQVFYLFLQITPYSTPNVLRYDNCFCYWWYLIIYFYNLFLAAVILVWWYWSCFTTLIWNW